MAHEMLKGHLDMLLLSVLSRRPAHGYAIIAALKERSGGSLDLPEGTIYPALHRLERLGQVVSSWAEGSTRKRRVYAVTGLGGAALERQRREWKDLTGAVRAVLAWAP
jgi:PadR family transcriptional regulator, regulatory protein PadR